MSARAVCPLCGSSDFEVVYDLTTAHSPDDLLGRVVRCRSCPMWFKLLSDPGGIPKAYPGEHGQDALAQTYLRGDAARALFRAALSAVVVSAQANRPRLLDIGAGQGTLLEEAGRMGFDAEGIDHCEENVRDACARSLKARCASAEDLDAYEQFDVVTMMDVLEHLPDPLRVLVKTHRALKPGGELVVYTPNHRAAVVMVARLLYALGMRHPVREIFGRNHISFFDDRSLPRALAQTGFTVRLQEQFPFDPSRPGQDMSRLNLAVVTAVESLGRPFNRVFRMLTYARKPSAV